MTKKFLSNITAPNIILTGSTVPANGLYLPAANTLGLATNSTSWLQINSVGEIGLGASPTTGQSLNLSKNITGATTAYGIFNSGQVQSDVTSGAYLYRSYAQTQAASFTLTNMIHYYASQGTFGAGSTVTNQYGFWVFNTLTGATNNYGFFGQLAAAANTYNLYMSGTASNYLAGSLGIGTTPATATALTVGKTLTGSTDARQVTANGVIQSDVTGTARNFLSNPSTLASSFTLGALYHFQAAQGTIGAGSAITTQIGFYASAITGATNNIGFQGDVAAATNAYNLYMSGTADNYLAGHLGLGLPVAATSLSITQNLTGAATYYGVNITGSIQSDVTTDYRGFVSAPTNQATSFNMASVRHFFAAGITIQAPATATSQYGFSVSSALNSAASNYGFHGNIALATANWNLYMSGTAANYVAGVFNVGSTTLTLGSGGVAAQLAVVTTATTTVGLVVKGIASQSANLQEWQSPAALLSYVDSTGNHFAPSLVLTGPNVPTNGLYLPSTNTLGFSTGAVARMQINASGEVGIGGNPSAAYSVRIWKKVTGATSSLGLVVNGIAQSDVTTGAFMVTSQIGTAAAAFTLTSGIAFIAQTSSIGAGSAITSTYGFYADSSLKVTGVTNAYGFWSNLAAAANVWLLYGSSTAASYVGGVFNVGSTTLTLGSGGVAAQLAVVTTATTTVGAVIRGSASQTADLLQLQSNTPANLVSVTAAGTFLMQQPTVTAINATGTVTIANLLTQIITTTSATAVSLTLPTGTLMDGGFNAISTNQAFDWSVINLGSASGAITFVAGASHTIVGSTALAIGISAQFRSVRTGVTTWVTYRLA